MDIFCNQCGSYITTNKLRAMGINICSKCLQRPPNKTPSIWANKIRKSGSYNSVSKKHNQISAK